MSEYRWAWIVDESLPHRGTYGVIQGTEIVCTTNAEKNGYETAVRIARAMNLGLLLPDAS